MSQVSAAQMQEQLEQAFGREQSSAEAMIARMAMKLAHVSCDQFLRAFALAAAETFKLDFFMIGLVNPFSNITRSICHVVDGELAPNFTYGLDGTPCARVIDSACCAYPNGVAELFPRDRFLEDNGIEGYVGVNLLSSEGVPLGLVVGLSRTPMDNENSLAAVLEHFSARAAAALESTQQLERYSWAANEASDGIWDWDIVTGGATISKRIQTILGYKKGRGPYDLEQIERAIHPDDLKGHKEALNRHIGEQTPYNVKFRLKTVEGDYRWFRSRGKAMRNDQGRAVRMVGCFSDIHDFIDDTPAA